MTWTQVYDPSHRTLLSILVFLWGTPQMKDLLNGKKTVKESAATLGIKLPFFTGGAILRYVFFHSIALAALVGIFVYLQAYVAPFTKMVVK